MPQPEVLELITVVYVEWNLLEGDFLTPKQNLNAGYLILCSCRQENKYKAQSGALVRLPRFRGLREPSMWLCIDKLGTQTEVILVTVSQLQLM